MKREGRRVNNPAPFFVSRIKASSNSNGVRPPIYDSQSCSRHSSTIRCRQIFNSSADYEKFLSLMAVQKVRLTFFLYAYPHASVPDTIARILHLQVEN